jgi:1-acyl-sn-glycerol-3-phosphate acyltransferase
MFMSALWAYLVVDPLICLSTMFFGTINLFVSLFDKVGNAQMVIARMWARSLLIIAGVRVTAVGLEKIDLSKPFVIAANHASFFDTPVILDKIGLQFRFLAKEGLFKIPLLGSHLKLAGHVPVPQKDPRAALRTMQAAADNIREKRISMLIFPEGGRTRDGSLQEFKEGVAYIAIKAGVPIIPVALAGTREVLAMGSAVVRRGKVTLRVGDPISTEGLSLKERQKLTDEVRGRIEALLGKC